MTPLREAAQQALEALELIDKEFKKHGRQHWPEAAKARNTAPTLRAALAEHFCDTHCTWADHAPGCVRAEPVQEPVAWLVCSVNAGGSLSPEFAAAWKELAHDHINDAIYEGVEGAAKWVVRPVYTAPPQRKSLTEEEIHSLFRASGSPVEFARAVERAHGIGDSDD